MEQFDITPEEEEKILKNVKGISFVYLNELDVVRHNLVTRIIKAYGKISDGDRRKEVDKEEPLLPENQ